MKIQSPVRRVLLALAAGSALCAAPFALADPVTLDPTGFANGYESFTVHNVPAPIFNPLPRGRSKEPWTAIRLSSSASN